jgi:hypothetical protein
VEAGFDDLLIKPINLKASSRARRPQVRVGAIVPGRIVRAHNPDQKKI